MRRRHSRLSVLGALAILFLVSGTLASCAPNGESGGSTTAPEDTSPSVTTVPPAQTSTSTVPLREYGGRVTIGTTEEPTALNAYVPGSGGESVFRIGQAYWAGAQEIDGATLTLRPDLIVELPDVANGGVILNADGTMTVTYEIRPEAVWADGTPISGNDFAFTYRAIMEQRVAVDPAGYEDIIPESLAAGPKRFSYTLRTPTVLYQLLFGLVLPEHDVAGSDLAADWATTMWVSGGPFILAEWVPGDYLRLIRNDRYWKTDAAGRPLPYLDEVVFKFLPAEELVDALLTGDVDVVTLPPDSETMARLGDASGITFEVREGPSWEHLNFQFGDGRFLANSDSLGADEEFRRAVFHAIDRDRIVAEVFAGLVAPIDTYVGSYVGGISEEPWARYDYDPAAARRLLDGICERAGRDCETDPLAVDYTTTADNEIRLRTVAVIGGMLTEVGISFQARLQESQVFLGETLPFGRWDVAQWAYNATPGYAGLVSIHDVFAPSGPPPSGLNFYRWGTPAVSGAIPAEYDQGPSSVRDDATERVGDLRAVMSTTVDESALASYAIEVERIIADAAVILPLFRWPELGAAANVVGGYRLNPTDATDTWNIEEWYRTDR